jgi:hypothetical protein
MMLRKTVFCSAILAASHSYAEPVIYDISGHQKDELFISHFKVNESISYGVDSGNDMFLIDSNNNDTASENVDFNNVKKSKYFSYTFDDIFSWSITRNENIVEFKIDDHTLTNTSIEGSWDAVSFYLFNSFYMFKTAYVNLGITQWNGNELNSPLNYSLSLGNAANFILADDNQEEITSIGGSIAFDGKIHWWSSFFNDTPGHSLSSTWTAYDLDNFGYSDEIDLGFGDSNIKNVNSPYALIATLILSTMLFMRIKRS